MAECNDEAYVNSWFELSKSDYAKVIFCEISPYDRNLGAGCRFQITDSVHEDPCDYVGLFHVGWENLSECIVSKLLSETECEEDGKILRCNFKGKDLPELEDGFYQFLYITRDNEVCGASTPFSVDKTEKCESSDEDIVADKTEDDFLVVRSQLFEKNHILERKLKQCQEKITSLGMERVKLLALIKVVSIENQSLQKSKETDAATLSSVSTEIESLKAALEDSKTTLLDHDMTHSIIECKLRAKIEKDAQEIIYAKKVNEELSKHKQNLEKLIMDSKASLLHNDRFTGEHIASMAQQYENTKAMLRASEDSKRLALLEIKKFQNCAEVDHNLKCENFALKLQLSDEKKISSKLNAKIRRLKKVFPEHDDTLMHKENLLSKLESTKSMSCSSEKKTQLAVEESNEHQQSVENEELLRLLTLTNDFEIEIEELRQSRNEKVEALEKMKDKVHDLTSNCALWEDDVNDLKSHCAQLNQSLQDKESSLVKLKEDCIKKEAVIEYLKKEKTQLLKTQAIMDETLNEMSSRLKEAAELYKKQYLKISALKKMRKFATTSKVSAFHQSSRTLTYNKALIVNCPSLETAPHCENLAAQSSDSDTGEHVSGATSENQIKVEEHSLTTQNREKVSAHSGKSRIRCLYPTEMAPSAPASESNDASGKADETATAKSEALHQLIEQNLANLSASGPVPKSEKDEVPAKRYSLPCTICESSINVLPHNTDDMVEHLEKVHKQQMCPICGRLFDMSLPHKYFVFHVEDHYNGSKPALYH